MDKLLQANDNFLLFFQCRKSKPVETGSGRCLPDGCVGRRRNQFLRQYKIPKLQHFGAPEGENPWVPCSKKRRNGDLGSEIQPVNVADKRLVVDVKPKDVQSRVFHVEAQVFLHT